MFARRILVIALVLLPGAVANASPPEDTGEPQPGGMDLFSATSTASTYFGGYRTDGGDNASAVLTVPDIPCVGGDTGVFPALGIRDFGYYVIYSGIFAVCQAGETQYSAALYAPGIERHIDHVVIEAGDRVRVEYRASNTDGSVSIENLTQGWRRHEGGFPAPDPIFAELGDYSVSLSGSPLPIPEFGRHKFSHARVDRRPVDDDISTKVTLTDADGQVRIDSFVAVNGTFKLWTKDPDLARGFPVFVRDPHVYQSGVRINATVANIDDDAELEVCGTGLGLAPAVCWDPDGNLVDGWQASGTENHSAEYISVGTFEPVVPTAITMTSSLGVTALDGHRDPLQGWPRHRNETDVPPTMTTSLDGQPMVVIGTADGVDALDATGRSLPGWPVEATDGGSSFQTPAIADVDGEAGVEIFSVGSASSLSQIYAYHEDGSLMKGYPLRFNSLAYTYPALGDVDGDGTLELVVTGRQASYPFLAKLYVFDAATGHLDGSHVLGANGPTDGVVALANLDQTCGPGALLHMIVQTRLTLEAVTWDGETFADRPGFPVAWGEDYWVSNSAPAVGDLNGDGSPDIAITGQVAGARGGAVFAFDATGELLRRFPKDLPLGSGGGPAIADIDLDGRNELVIKGSDTRAGWAPSLWVYDLGGGPGRPAEWGQFMNTSDHRSTYAAGTCASGEHGVPS